MKNECDLHNLCTKEYVITEISKNPNANYINATADFFLDYELYQINLDKKVHEKL